MDGDAPRLAVRFDEQHRFLAEHEHGGVAEKVRGDDRRAGRDRMGAVDDGRRYRRGCRSLQQSAQRTVNIKRCSSQSPAGFFPPADCGR